MIVEIGTERWCEEGRRWCQSSWRLILLFHQRSTLQNNHLILNGNDDNDVFDDDDDEVKEEDLEPGMKIWYGEWGCELCSTIIAEKNLPQNPPDPLNLVQTGLD